MEIGKYFGVLSSQDEAILQNLPSLVIDVVE